jgi:CxxC-x17-CxxC domain-containing protein
MSLGGDSYSTHSGMEKFKTICSLCKKETTVPFKPEPGRTVYCKDCMVKIKSGEVKVEKGREDQVRYDESKFFKPLSDLGIEFKPKKDNLETERYPERGEKHSPAVGSFSKSSIPVKQTFPVKKPGIFSTLKKVFNKTVPVQNTTTLIKTKGENFALREVLNKTLLENKLSPPAVSPSMSLEDLKKENNKPNKDFFPTKDRAATVEDMNKLKSLISDKVEKKEEKMPNSIPKKPVQEIPEDVLKKILE